MQHWELEREWWYTETKSSSPSLAFYQVLWTSVPCVLPPPSKPWPWPLCPGWIELRLLAWLLCLWWRTSLVWSALQAAECTLSGPPFPLPLKPVQPVCKGPVLHCAFPLTGQAAPAWLSGFCFFSGPSESSIWTYAEPSYLCSFCESPVIKVTEDSFARWFYLYSFILPFSKCSSYLASSTVPG